MSRALTSAVTPSKLSNTRCLGDDYELIFTVSEEQRQSLEIVGKHKRESMYWQLTGHNGTLSLLKDNEKYTPVNV